MYQLHKVLSLTSFLLSSVALSAPVTPQSLSNGSPLGSSFGIPGNQSFDYVIIGGGTAGLAVANRLSENPSVTVAVIEAGTFYELDNGNVSQIPLDDAIGTDKTMRNYNPLVDWGFETTPQKGVNNAVSHYARGKCLGGSSARNYMAYQRGSQDSYNEWANLVGDSSYQWHSFLPYFEKSLDFTPPDASKRAANATPQYDRSSLGPGDGPLSVTFSNYAQAISSWVQKGLAEIGIYPREGFTSGQLFGSSYVLETIQASNQLRETSETGFLQPALSRTNLIVFVESLATRIVFDNTQTATGVEVNSAGKQYTLTANKEVILSAGAFQSPQLLMVSGVGPTATLQKYGIPVVTDRAGVGQNMWDHVYFGPSYRVNVITGSSLGNPAFAAQAEEEFHNQAGILTNSGGDFFAWEKLPQSSRKSFSNSTLSALAAFPPDWPEVEYLTVGGFLGDNSDYDLITPTDGYNYVSVIAALVSPLSRGTVSIASSNMSDAPVINPNWLTDPTDQAVAVAAYKRLRQLFSTRAMAPVLIGPEYYPGHNGTQGDAELLDIIKTGYQTVWHASCTNKMGKTNDPMAVVDSKAQVIGVKNLRVVDASSFPLLPPGHPISTIYALAEKISDDIKAAA
ncbi:MAG: hypothetical protein M1821_005705 [Bathelium mastoideum]|nr:MAG: hypothetical protein M1821_005705 [Bathelium mastoideum]